MPLTVALVAGELMETIVDRIQGGTERLALTAGKSFTEEVAEVLERRLPRYQSAAHYAIGTNELTPQQVADRIIEIWNRKT